MYLSGLDCDYTVFRERIPPVFYEVKALSPLNIMEFNLAVVSIGKIACVQIRAQPFAFYGLFPLVEYVFSEWFLIHAFPILHQFAAMSKKTGYKWMIAGFNIR